MDEEVWEKHFRGYSIVDCAVFNEQRLCFCLKEDPPKNSPTQEDADLETRLVINRRDEKPGKDWVLVELRGIRHPRLGVATRPNEKLLVFGFFGEVYSLGGGKSAFEKDIPVPDGVSITDAAQVNGYLYVAGTTRTLFRREGENRWKALTSGLKTTAGRNEDELDWGFNAIDGFNEQDLYAAGGQGDLWSFDGKKWRQRDFPSNVEINGLACGGDGNVYVAGDAGTIHVGRDDDWQALEQDITEDNLDEVVWYRDRAFVATWLALYQLVKGEFKKVSVKGQHSFGHVGAGSGLLLSAGPKQAFLFDGKSWKEVVPDYEE